MWVKAQQKKLIVDSIISRGGCVGSNFDVGLNVKLAGGGAVRLGDNVYIGENTFIKGQGGLTMGNNVILSRNIVLYTVSHNYRGAALPYDSDLIRKPVIIEDNVWIGMNVTIAPGTRIREGAVIGLGARVFGEVPECSIVGSNGKIIGERDKTKYQHLKKSLKYADHDGRPL